MSSYEAVSKSGHSRGDGYVDPSHTPKKDVAWYRTINVHQQQADGAGFSQVRKPQRSRQIVRFRTSARLPETPVLPPEIPLRCTAEIGFRVPKLSSPRDKNSGESRDALYSSRRKRLADVRGLESIEMISRPWEVPPSERPPKSTLTYKQVVSECGDFFGSIGTGMTREVCLFSSSAEFVPHLQSLCIYAANRQLPRGSMDLHTAFWPQFELD